MSLTGRRGYESNGFMVSAIPGHQHYPLNLRPLAGHQMVTLLPGSYAFFKTPAPMLRPLGSLPCLFPWQH